MSRVDDAMRRAAELSGNGSATTLRETGTAFPQADVLELASEPYPVEWPGGRPMANDTGVQTGRPQVARPGPPAAGDEAPSSQSLAARIHVSVTEKVVVGTEIAAAAREEYRRLAAALHHAQVSRGIKVVMIASAVPGEGKTLTAANLALTLSGSYRRRVLLIDADLRRPALHTIFSVDNSKGLSEGLTSAAAPHLSAIQMSTELALIPGGRPNVDPMASLTSERMRHLLEDAREMFDWIVVDTPPVALLPDANLLATMVDAAVLVVNAGTTPYPLVVRAIAAIGRERILGTILNRAETSARPYEYAQYGRYQ